MSHVLIFITIDRASNYNSFLYKNVTYGKLTCNQATVAEMPKLCIMKGQQ